MFHLILKSRLGIVNASLTLKNDCLHEVLGHETWILGILRLILINSY